METVSISRESLFERLIPHFGSAMLGQWKWRHMAEDRGWWSELADWNRGRIGFRRLSVHPCL
jgi:hypothetical protein